MESGIVSAYFFPEHSKESLKTKYERLLRNKLLDELSRNPINA